MAMFQKHWPLNCTISFFLSIPCLLRSVLIAETPEDAAVLRGDTDVSCGPATPGDRPSYNLAPGCLPLITEQVER